MALKDLQLDARELREVLYLERPSGTPSPSSGQSRRRWTRYATVRGRVEPLTGREFWQAQEVNSQTTHRVKIRYVPGVTSKDRVIFGARELNITSAVNVEERGRIIILMCAEAT